jgi:PAS domain S-box-containing protein
MSPIRYLDFDLRIQRTETGFCSQVLNSPAGEANSSCEGRIFTELELESYFLKLGPGPALRRIGSPESAAAKDLGGRLFDSTFRGEVRDCLRQSLARAEEQGACLRIRLRLKDAPELASYPWEYLYDRNVNWFVALSGEAPVVRHLDLPLAIRPLKMSLPLRVLVIISSPSGCPQISHEREVRLLDQAFEPLRQDGKVELTRLPDATLDTLDRWLARGEYHILHFIGHGAFDRQIDDGVLILEDAEKQQRWTTGEALGIHLRSHRTLRLAVLNACEGARGSPHDPFSGVAQSLAQQGLPAVIAMQFEITDAAAVDFSRGFYGALVEGYPVDAALSRARLVLHANNHGLEWGTPVLYLRSRDGVVFESEETRPSSVSRNPLPIVRARVRVFLSYSHDDKKHCDLVLALAQQLRRDGIDAELDQFHQNELLHWPRWCEECMRPENSDYVLCVCSREYRNRVEGRAAADVGKGVFWEGTLLYNALYDQQGHNTRFIAVLLADAGEAHVPQILSGYTRFRLSSFELGDPRSDYALLHRLLTGQRGSRLSGPEQLKKLEPLPEKLRRTDFVKLSEDLIGEQQRLRTERQRQEEQERLRTDQRQQEERERSETERHQEEAQEMPKAEQEGFEAERRERKEKEWLLYPWVFDYTPLGVIKVDTQGQCEYANKKFASIVGEPNFEGHNLRELFPGEQNQAIIEEQIKKQRPDDYDIVLTRLDNKRPVPVRIASTPLLDSAGGAVGAIAIFRELTFERAVKRITESIANCQTSGELLSAVSNEIRKVISFDQLHVSAYSDKRYVRSLFADPQLDPTSKVRWYKMSAPIAKFAAKRDASKIDDMDDYYHQTGFVTLKTEDLKKQSWLERPRSLLRCPLIRKGRVVASLSIARRKPNSFGERDYELFNSLPIREVLTMALHLEDNQRLQFRLDLMESIFEHWDDQERVASVIVQRLLEHHDWDHAAFFHVDEKMQEIRLLGQKARNNDPAFLLESKYKQDLDFGVLGFVYQRKQAVNIGDLANDVEYKTFAIRRFNSQILSELCLPVVIGERVCWMLNLEDSRENAFSPEEITDLQVILDDVKNLLDATWSRHFFETIVDSLSDAIITVDGAGCISKVNPAVESLLGYSHADLQGVTFLTLLDPRRILRILDVVLNRRQRFCEQVTLTRKDGTKVTVLLSASPLSQASGGAVFLARDLSLNSRSSNI